MTARQVAVASPGPERPSGARWWFAVPPKSSGLEPLMFRGVQEARAAARAGGYGWSVEGRVVEIDEQAESEAG